MKMQKLLLLIIILFGTNVSAQNLTQTIRGTVMDFDTKTPIIGAKIMVVNSDPLQASITNVMGEFKIENVPVGRIPISITSIGYQPMSMPSVLIESGKEKVMNIEMVIDIQVLDKVEVSANGDKTSPLNKMATVSAKTFSVEETNRYAGSLNDPARMVSGFAGVNGDAEGDNDIVVRGNSPRGVLWRLEGIDIPNPNHFSGEGSTGGPVNALNGSVLANSDFFSGAFAPEYGNALSGVFDVKFRQGNNEKREYALSVGVLGVDGTAEGPFKKGYNGSYLANYRYSTISILDKLGFLDFSGIPVYQDASFKVVLPSKKLGTFSLIGLGGVSHIVQRDEDEKTGKIYGEYDYGANLGVVGLKHIYVINPKLYIKSFASAMSSYNGGNSRTMDADSVLYLSDVESFTDTKYKFQTILNYKFNQKNIFQVGGTYTQMQYKFSYETDENQNKILKRQLFADGNSGLVQSFVSWKYRISNDLTMVSGLNHTHFLLNDNMVIEPRLGVKYQLNKRHNLSVGFGLHSRLESLSTYNFSNLQEDGSYLYPNKNLDFTKSAHYVLGYGFSINENLHLKSEVYYQHLYNVPIHGDTSSQFSSINYSAGIPNFKMENKGTGRNYGVELTLERFFQNNFYFLATTSLYKSLYTSNDGIERNSRYDANFACNFLVGKEFKVGKKGNKTIGVNSKLAYLGGNRYTPINLEASILEDETVRVWDKPYSAKGDNIFIMNLGVTYRIDAKKSSHSFKIDIQNLTNNQAKVSDYYNGRTGQVEYDTQLEFIPNIVYTIKF